MKIHNNIKLVGALTSKPYAFNARSWELKNVETIDLFDSLNSNIVLNIRNTDILRILPTKNSYVNDEWISDKARFSFDGLKRWRFITPMVKINDLFEEKSWKNTFKFIKTKLDKTLYETIIVESGYFSDLESITNLKDFNIPKYKKKLTVTPYQVDLQQDFLINENFKSINTPKVVILVGINTRLVNPVFNIKLRQISLNKNVLIGHIGSHTNMNIQSFHLGSNISNLKKLVEGKHWFCKEIERFIKYNNKGEKLLNDFKTSISFIFGEEFFSIKNATQIFNTLKKQKSQHRFNFNVLIPYSGIINKLELGLQENINIYSEKPLIFYLNGSERNFSIKNEDFVIFQGHHNDLLRDKIDVILPATNWFEKNSKHINCYGLIQKTKYAALPPTNVRDDWKITQMLAKTLTNNFYHLSSKSLENRLNQFTPVKMVKNSILEGFYNITTLACNKTKTSIYNKTFKNSKYDYYTLTSVERASKVMNECTKVSSKNLTNYIKL